MVLHPLIGNTYHQVKNSDQFTDIIKDPILQPNNIMFSFDVVSLFTNIPTADACNIARENFSVALLLGNALTSTLTRSKIYVASYVFQW